MSPQTQPLHCASISKIAMRAGWASAFAQFASKFCCDVNNFSLLSPIDRNITIYIGKSQILAGYISS